MRRHSPLWFQDRLTRIGGHNPHGDPRFKLVWCESETMRDGGYFVRDGYQGYRDVPAYGRDRCWAIVMWEPAIMHGTPYRWYKDHTDKNTSLVTLGQYPYHGRYRLIHKLVHREYINGNLHTWRMEPTHFILDVMVPLIIRWNKLSNEQRMDVVKQEQEQEEKETDRILEDSLHACRIRRDSPLVQKKLEFMERTMGQAMEIATHTQRGIHQIGA